MPRSTKASKSSYAAAARHMSLPRIFSASVPCGLPLDGPHSRSQSWIIDHHETIRAHGLRTKANDQ